MTYKEIADQEAVTLCHACSEWNHKRGSANPSRGVVHWAPRRVSRIGLRRFLMLVAAIKRSHNRGQPRWLQVYEQNTYAYRQALDEYHVRLNRRLSMTDRANVRYWMGKEGVLSDAENRNIARWAMERD